MNRHYIIVHIARTGILAAMATILYFIKFPLPIFPEFLEIQISNLPCVIAGFALGPLWGVIVVVIKCLIKMPFSGTFCVGEFADFLIGCAIVIPSSLIYKKYRTKKSGVIGILIGCLTWVLVATLANYFILLPFFIKISGGDASAIIGMSKMIPGINESNYMSKIILWGIIPFNLMLSTLTGLITYFVYKSLSNFLKRIDYKEKNDE